MAEEVAEDKTCRSREEWKTSAQFFFTVLGFCVGLGNIWRFPYLCQTYGGGAFVIPFLILTVLEGMPLMLLELGIGQKLRMGSYGAWKSISPWLTGIGLGSTLIAIIVGSYYNVIITWCLYYLFMSFRFTLPWDSCPEINGTLTAECERSSETQYFWYREALDISESINELNGINWPMFILLVVAWIVVYLIIMKGIQSSGYIVYFTALFPYLVLTVFFIRGMTLKGSIAGLTHMFSPQMDQLLSPTVWLLAATQVFYSYGIAFGSIIGFGSYNDKKKNCVFDVYVISACNSFTAVFACAVVFSILGFKAQHLYESCITSALDHLNISYEDFDEANKMYQGLQNDLKIHNCSLETELNKAAQGTGLAFIVMADIFTKLPWAPFWSLLFFSMLLTLGLGSQIGIMEGLIGTLFDLKICKSIKKPILTGLAVLGCFMISLLFVTRAGEYWLTLFDIYGAMGLTMIAFAEIMSVSFVYGHQKFKKDIEDMTGVQLGVYWQIMWRFVSPLLIAIVLISSLITEMSEEATYFAWRRKEAKVTKENYGYLHRIFGYLLAFSCLIPSVIICLSKFWSILRRKPTSEEPLESALKPMI